VTAGFRDWGPTTVAGTTILGGNSTGRGGLFAVDMLTGKFKWTSRPTTPHGSPGVSTAPAVSGDVVIVPMGNTLMAQEPNWSFGFVTPVDGGLWVDSYQVLVKLQ
jgi:outer membrane protein assembly factor BamB